MKITKTLDAIRHGSFYYENGDYRGFAICDEFFKLFGFSNEITRQSLTITATDKNPRKKGYKKIVIRNSRLSRVGIVTPSIYARQICSWERDFLTETFGNSNELILWVKVEEA